MHVSIRILRRPHQSPTSDLFRNGRKILPKGTLVYKTFPKKNRSLEMAPFQKHRIGWTPEGISVYCDGERWLEVLPREALPPLYERFPGLNGGGD